MARQPGNIVEHSNPIQPNRELQPDGTTCTNLSVDVPAYRELGLRGDGDVDERGLRAEVLAHLDEDLEGVAPVQLLLLAVVLQQPLHELGRHRGVVLKGSFSHVEIFQVEI